MKIPQKTQALRQVIKVLAYLLGLPPSEGKIQVNEDHDIEFALLSFPGLTFQVFWKASGAAGPVSAALREAREKALTLAGPAIPLVSVPFMGPVGRKLCEEARVGWLDLSGNARILAPGIRILTDGRPNRFKRPGRPASVFAPKSARIVRWLLMHPKRPVAQREIARATGMDEGFTSRIVARLLKEGWVNRGADKKIRVPDPGLLLEAWKEAYDFGQHERIQGHVPSRTGSDLLRRAADVFKSRGVQYAATGLGAAWLLVQFGGFRTVTFFLEKHPDPILLEYINFREERRGANLWLVVPKDEGVFHGAADRGEIHCVHPVQAYIDLKAHPERADEAAREIRRRILE